MSAAGYYHDGATKLSDTARTAFQDLKGLGYDIEALGRRNMDDYQILELRDKAFKFRGIQIPASERSSSASDFAGPHKPRIVSASQEDARTLAKHILYLAEKALAES